MPIPWKEILTWSNLMLLLSTLFGAGAFFRIRFHNYFDYVTQLRQFLEAEIQAAIHIKIMHGDAHYRTVQKTLQAGNLIRLSVIEQEMKLYANDIINGTKDVPGLGVNSQADELQKIHS